jgi:hypothetical protein
VRTGTEMTSPTSGPGDAGWAVTAPHPDRKRSVFAQRLEEIYGGWPHEPGKRGKRCSSSLSSDSASDSKYLPAGKRSRRG